MRSFWEDLRFGLRVLRNSPGFTVVAVLTLGLGIAANTTVFSWIDAIVLHPLPAVARIDEVVAVEPFMPTGEFNSAPMVEYRHFRESMKTVPALAAAHFDTFSIGDPESGGPVWGELVSDNYFDALGITATQAACFGPANTARHPLPIRSPSSASGCGEASSPGIRRLSAARSASIGAS
jgi:hypothetical protein